MSLRVEPCITLDNMNFELFHVDNVGEKPRCGCMISDGTVLFSVVGQDSDSGRQYVRRVFNSMLKGKGWQ